MIYSLNPDRAEHTSLQPGDEIWITLKGDITILRNGIPLALDDDEPSSASITMYNQAGAKHPLTPKLAAFQAKQLASIAGLAVNPEPKFQETGVPQYYFRVIARP